MERLEVFLRFLILHKYLFFESIVVNGTEVCDLHLVLLATSWWPYPVLSQVYLVSNEHMVNETGV